MHEPEDRARRAELGKLAAGLPRTGRLLMLRTMDERRMKSRMVWLRLAEYDSNEGS